MKFTIGIPTYNRAAFLQKAIQSALAQDYPKPYQILVMNNASTDNTEAVLSPYRDQITIMTNERTVPMHENFNLMFRNASGEYVLILNDDDLLEKSMLSNCDQHLGNQEGIGLICTAFDTIDENDNVIAKPSYLPASDRLTPLEAVRELAEHGHFIATVASFCHRQSFLTVGGFQGGSVQFDLILQMKLLLKTGRDLLAIHKIGAHVRRHESSGGVRHFVTHRVVRDQLEAYREIADMLPAGTTENRLKDLLLRKATQRLYKYIPVIDIVSGREELNHFVKELTGYRPDVSKDFLFRLVLLLTRITPNTILTALLVATREPSILKLIRK